MTPNDLWMIRVYRGADAGDQKDPLNPKIISDF
jgi:hypothetical protein